MKVIAFYLPQFHEIPENNEWWGKGFTEWVNVKKAVPLFEGHVQPRVPLNNYYYDLTDREAQIWQANLAKKYGVYGFAYYHYWFNGKLLLEKPAENMLYDTEVDIPFCFSWANEPWTNVWVSQTNSKVLLQQTYGGKEEWLAHFNYLLPFFKDKRYIKNNGKPLFIIYRPDIIPNLNEMIDYFQEKAEEAGLPGIDFAYQHLAAAKEKMEDDSRFEYNIHFEPIYAEFQLEKNKYKLLKEFKRRVADFFEHYTSINIRSLTTRRGLKVYDYDTVWNNILNRKPYSLKCVPGVYVDWDNTPRKGINGKVHKGACPEKFKKYFYEQVKRTKDVYHQNMIFVYAWNEWAEGGYLEPDERFKYGYLEAIHDVLEELDELENQTTE